MIRRYLNTKIEYTLHTNQGNPDVWIDGIKVAKVSNGVATWVLPTGGV